MEGTAAPADQVPELWTPACNGLEWRHGRNRYNTYDGQNRNPYSYDSLDRLLRAARESKSYMYDNENIMVSTEFPAIMLPFSSYMVGTVPAARG